MSMQVAPPGGDVAVQVGDAVNNWHGILHAARGPFHSLANLAGSGSRRPQAPIDRIEKRPQTGPAHAPPVQSGNGILPTEIVELRWSHAGRRNFWNLGR